MGTKRGEGRKSSRDGGKERFPPLDSVELVEERERQATKSKLQLTPTSAEGRGRRGETTSSIGAERREKV